jgi:hypothetical protein
MKKKILKVFCMLMLMVGIGMVSENCIEAKTLKENKTYKINLDGKNAKEKIRVKKKLAKDGHYTIFSLYINGKKVAKQEGYTLYCYTLDINKKEKGKDLVFYASTESMCLSDNAGIFSYRGGKLKRLMKLHHSFEEMSLYRIDKVTTNGKGMVTVVADSPCQINIGSFYALIRFRLKSGKLVKVTNGKFDLNKYSQRYEYVLNETAKVYQSANSTSEEVTVLKKNTKLNILKVSYKKVKKSDGSIGVSDAYAYIKVADGTTGWILLRAIDYDNWEESQQQFKIFPAWG